MQPSSAWAVETQRLLNQEHPATRQRVHEVLGVYPETLDRVWPFLAVHWPAQPAYPLTVRFLCWTLWFCREYPTKRTATEFYHVVWAYMVMLALLLPQVRALVCFLSGISRSRTFCA
jgi:hypothetical protein